MKIIRLALTLTACTALLNGANVANAQDPVRIDPARGTMAIEENVGDAATPIDEPRIADLSERRERLRSYLAGRRARLDIVTTTMTDSGQVIDWIRRDSQVPSGRIASPPALEQVIKTGDKVASFELTEQLHARGPEGTVPILRRDVEEVLNGNLPSRVEDFLSKYGRESDRRNSWSGRSNGPEQPGTSDHEYANTRQHLGNFGGHGNINLWNPYVWKSGEFSLGQVAVARQANGSPLQTVETGWQDYRGLYGDYYPHLFVYYTTNGYASQADNLGGYNRDVDGFVQYSATAFPGARITTRSILGGTQYSLHIRVQLYAGNWWIRAGNNWVGYYPASLFSANGLRNRADSLSWYGEIVDLDDGVNTYTDMGSGQFASAGWRWAAYMRNIRIYNVSNGSSYDYNPDAVWVTDAGCYSVDNHARSGGSWGSYFWWGGPGKSASCP